MARSSSTALKRPPAPSSPSLPTPAGGFGRRAPAIDLDLPADADVAVDTERRRGRGAQSNASGRYEPTARFTTWLFRIVYNLAVNETQRGVQREPRSLQGFGASRGGSGGRG